MNTTQIEKVLYTAKVHTKGLFKSQGNPHPAFPTSIQLEITHAHFAGKTRLPQEPIPWRGNRTLGYWLRRGAPGLEWCRRPSPCIDCAPGRCCCSVGCCLFRQSQRHAYCCTGRRL